MSINKKNHMNIKCSLLNKTLHLVKTDIFFIKLWRKLTKLYPMTTISSVHKNEIQFFRNHLPCPWILIMIRRNKWFNPPAYRHIYTTDCHYYLDIVIKPNTVKSNRLIYRFASLPSIYHSLSFVFECNISPFRIAQ